MGVVICTAEVILHYNIREGSWKPDETAMVKGYAQFLSFVTDLAAETVVTEGISHNWRSGRNLILLSQKGSRELWFLCPGKIQL